MPISLVPFQPIFRNFGYNILFVPEIEAHE